MMSKSTWSLTLALSAMASAAAAQGVPAGKIEAKPAAETAARPEAARAPLRQAPAQIQRIEGLVLRAEDGTLWVGTPIRREEQDALLRMGFTLARTPNEVRHRSIFGGRSYGVYPVRPGTIEEQALQALVGREVVLGVERFARGEVVVVSVKQK